MDYEVKEIAIKVLKTEFKMVKFAIKARVKNLSDKYGEGLILKVPYI